MAKYLTRLGWEVTVVTPRPAVWRYTEDPEKTDTDLRREGIRRILTEYRWRCLVPDHLHYWDRGPGWLIGGVCRRIARRLSIDDGIGWVKAAEHACSRLTPTDVDVILASGSPFASFTVAQRLAQRLGRPYVLDYRDPWTVNPAETRPARPAIIRQEAGLLADCAAVTIVSPSWAAVMEQRFGLGPKLHVITNGYDPEELAPIVPHNFGHAAFVYAGSFYPPMRVISPVMAALSRLKQTLNGDSGEWYFHYYGRQETHVRQEAEQFGVMDRVVLHGNVSRSAVLSAVQGARAAVVIMSTGEGHTKDDKGWVPAKVFETLGLGTPTLLVAPPGSDIETIVEPTGFVRRFTGSDIDGMAMFLTNAMRGSIPAPNKCEAYAWTTLAAKLDTILREVIINSI